MGNPKTNPSLSEILQSERKKLEAVHGKAIQQEKAATEARQNCGMALDLLDRIEKQVNA